MTILLCGQVGYALRPISGKEDVNTLVPEMGGNGVFQQQRLPRIPPAKVGLKSLKICRTVIAVTSSSKIICLKA